MHAESIPFALREESSLTDPMLTELDLILDKPGLLPSGNIMPND